MDTVGGMNKVQTISREKPSIEGTWNPCNETCPRREAHLFFECVIELGQRSENCVEIIPWEVIQKHSKLGGTMA